MIERDIKKYDDIKGDRKDLRSPFQISVEGYCRWKLSSGKDNLHVRLNFNLQ